MHPTTLWLDPHAKFCFACGNVLQGCCPSRLPITDGFCTVTVVGRMNTEQLLEKWRSLPKDKQQEVIDFVEFLELKKNHCNWTKSRTEV
jgi:hypothetical protein